MADFDNRSGRARTLTIVPKVTKPRSVPKETLTIDRRFVPGVDRSEDSGIGTSEFHCKCTWHFKFSFVSTQRAEKAYRIIRSLRLLTQLKDPSFSLHQFIDGKYYLKNLVQVGDGKVTDLIEKFEAKCALEHPFLCQFVRWSTVPTSVERVEAVPFAGENDDDVDPGQVQSAFLLDLLKDPSAVEFGGSGHHDAEGTSIALRFHAIVAAPPSSSRAGPGGAKRRREGDDMQE